MALPIARSPDANALELSDAVRAAMNELARNFSEGMSYEIGYDPTQAVRKGSHAVVETLLETIALAVLVVVPLLQTWRAPIIPLLAMPVSAIGTFALLHELSGQSAARTDHGGSVRTDAGSQARRQRDLLRARAGGYPAGSADQIGRLDRDFRTTHRAASAEKHTASPRVAAYRPLAGCSSCLTVPRFDEIRESERLSEARLRSREPLSANSRRQLRSR